MAFSGSGAAAGASAGSVFGPWGTAAGAVLGGFFGGSKKAPGSAAYSPVDLQEEQRRAIAGNLSNEKSIEALAGRANAFNQDQAITLMERAMPGYTKLASRLTGLATDLATNPYDLPPDVQANIERQAAERGISVGTSGQTQGFSLLRDLGINSLNYGQSRINQSQSLAGLLAGISPRVNPMSPLSFYVTPGQSAQVQQGTNLINQEIAQGDLNSRAAEDNYQTQSLWDALAFGGGLLGKEGAGKIKGDSKDLLARIVGTKSKLPSDLGGSTDLAGTSRGGYV